MEIQKDYYPSIAQSWGMLGIIILISLFVSPIVLLSDVLPVQGLAAFLSYALSMGLPFLVFHLVRKKRTGEFSYAFKPSSAKVFVLIIVATAAIQYGITGPLSNLIPMPEFFMKIFMDSTLNAQGFLPFITVVVAEPVLEELIFRGIILDGLLKKYSPTKAIIVSALLFGIVHLNPWQFVGATILGLFIGWVYYRTRNLSLAILIHFVNNLIPAIIMNVSDAYKSGDVQALMNETLVESYGGLVSMILIISGCIVVAGACIYLLWKEFNENKNNNHTISSSELSE
ncbi:CPBP family intramembrane metalloprotease [Paludibacter sp. 221]|uniref:CPBP family intramembrane glutamic endopeptidase n=1 Tax=Paludibacter sp. 221 TaxID=2302939 RepID=UPI0013D4B253|nr:type II CAAX endopeptidase family protein [Paludibacter sp. 221]NDV46312.1 CPBP family intramembrane metalloprotease [Paludibacter sp. 221]